ncbi:MAG: hypothetical protein ACKOPE_05705 [Novosphingobium sp.]
MGRAIIVLCLALVALSGQRVDARTVGFVEIVCPVGGQRFFVRGNPEMRRRIEAEPSGRYLGRAAEDPFERCPNGYVIYKDRYSRAELEALARLIRDPGYKALADRPTYRSLWWIRKQQGADAFELADLLGKANRECFFGKDRQIEIADFLAAVAQLPYTRTRHAEWFRLNLLAANELRIAGHSAGARKLLEALTAPALNPSPVELAQLRTIATLVEESNIKRFTVALDDPEAVQSGCLMLRGDKRSTRSEADYCATPAVRHATAAYCRATAFDHKWDPQYSDCTYKHPGDWLVPPIAALTALLLMAAMLFGRSSPRGAVTRCGTRW